MMCSLVSHPWALRTEARPGGSVLALTPGPRPPARLTRCRPRCGCASGPGSGRRRGSASAPWRAPWRSACWRTGWDRCTRPSAAWRLRATGAWVRAARPTGSGSRVERGGDGMRKRLAPYPAPGGHSPCTAGGCTPARRLHGGRGDSFGSGAPRASPPPRTPSSAAPSPLPGICIIRQPHFRAT